MLDITRAYGLNFLVPAGDTAVGWSLRAFGEFAKPELDLLAAYLKHFQEPGTFLDVGANIGAICLPLGAWFPTWQVIGVEAHRGLSGLLAANALNNHLRNVEWHHAAAGATAGLAEFPSTPLDQSTNFGALGAFMNNDVATEQVRMCTVDQIAPARTRLIKVDVEGAELAVLHGAFATLRDIKPVWLLEAKRQDKQAAAAIARVLREANYRLFVMFAPFATLHHAKPAQIRPGPSGDFNFLALPSGVPNLWELPELKDVMGEWPSDLSAFPYLRRYGYAAS